MTPACPSPCLSPVFGLRYLDLLASLSRCRAAGRRWGARAVFALQMCAAFGTKHQTKGTTAPLRTCVERFVPTVPSAQNRVGTREAPVYAVSPLSPLSPLQMSVPRAATRAGRGRFASFSPVLEVAKGYLPPPPVIGSFRGSSHYGSKRARQSASKRFSS